MAKVRDLLRFDGRLSRIEYWRNYLLLAIVGAVTWCVGLAAILVVGPFGGVLLLPVFPILVATFAIVVRRLHDRGKSGWWLLPFWAFPLAVSAALSAETPGSSPRMLLALTALFSFGLSIWGLVEIGFRRGAAGANQYGEAPQPAVKATLA